MSQNAEAITITGTVIDKPSLVFDTPGREDSAELQFTVMTGQGVETGVFFRHNPLADETPSLRQGDTVTVNGLTEGPGYLLEMEYLDRADETA